MSKIDFVDFSIPIQEIGEGKDHFIIDAHGIFHDLSGNIPDKKIGVIFKFKKNLEPHMKFITDENGVLINLEYSETSNWEIAGSSLELTGEQGLNFANFLLELVGESKRLDKIEEKIFFDIILLAGDMRKIEISQKGDGKWPNRENDCVILEEDYQNGKHHSTPHLFKNLKNIIL